MAVVYTASIGVGSPPTQYDLLIDTGSSDTWLGAGKGYVRTNTSVETTNVFDIGYGSGGALGIEYLDTVTLAEGLAISNQSIGVAALTQGFDNYNGILGIGPLNLTADTLFPDTNDTIPTVTDTLFSQGAISSSEVGVSFQPTTNTSETNGELTFGGTDSSKYTGTISYTDLTTTYPASSYWGINQTVTYGSTNGQVILTSAAGIVDTGTTLILIASDAFATYAGATSATLDNTTGLYTITADQYSNLQSLFFNIGGETLELTPNAQIWPRSLNSAIGGLDSIIYLVISDIGYPSGEGLDFVNGFTFLQRFYSVFDTGGKRVGFAKTPLTTATSN